MSQYSPSKDLQSKSKSIYSSACQNEAELNQIMNRRPRAKKKQILDILIIMIIITIIVLSDLIQRIILLKKI